MAPDQPTWSFGWQGGEPTLMGRRFFEHVTEFQEKYGKRGASVANGLQTNGILITDEFAEHLARYHFLVGVSVDGSAEIHNTNRLTESGRGTHEQVLRGIERLQRNGVEYNILTVVSKANVHRAREVYRYLRDDLGVMHHQYIPCVEFAPDGSPAPFSITGEEWGAFLLDIFDEWHGGDEERVSVRLFDSVLTMMVDGVANNCVMAKNCRQYFVVEHNGDVYPCDFFVDPEKRLGNVMRDRFEDMWQSVRFRDFGRNKRKWNAECVTCPYLTYCAGDCQKMRYRVEEDPSQLSALCAGWKAFYGATLPEFEQIATRVRRMRFNDSLSTAPMGIGRSPS